MGPRLGRVEYADAAAAMEASIKSFNGATLRTRGIHYPLSLDLKIFETASMGPRLGRVEYGDQGAAVYCGQFASMGPRLGRVEYGIRGHAKHESGAASMGPRLGRVEYQSTGGVNVLPT